MGTFVFICRRSASNLFDSIRNKCNLVTNFPNLDKNYYKIKPSLNGFFVDDYIIFYYPQTNGIIITKVINSCRDLEKFFSE